MTPSRFHPLARLFFCVLGLIAATIVMGVMLFVGSAVATVWTGRPPGPQLEEVTSKYALQLTLFSYPALILWISYCRTHFDRFSLVSLGLRARRAFPDAARGAITGALSIAFLWLVLWITGALAVSGWSEDVLEGGAGRAGLALAGYALMFMGVGFFEELLFRGYALHNFNDWLGWKGAVAAQATIFAVIHLGNVAGGTREAVTAAVGALPSLVLIAVFFALCYRKTGSLWFPIGFHFAWNFCLGTVFSLPVSGIETFKLLNVSVNEKSWLSGGSFGAEGSLLLIPILLALIYFISLSHDHPQAILDLSLGKGEEAPAPLPAAPPVPEEVETEAERERRYRTKFGTSQGFSADTLRELRELQEEREKKQREAREAARREELATSSFSGQSLDAVSAEVAPVTEVVTASVVPEPIASPVVAPVPVAAPVVAPEPVKPAPVAPAPVKPAPVTPAPSGDAPVKKKPPAPRW